MREAFSKYYRSEGCNCCQNVEDHNVAKDEIGKLLGFKKYTDGSGYDFYNNGKSKKQ